MGALFCLRLATGLLAALLVLTPSQINPRFYRTQFLIALGLTAVALLLSYESATVGLWLALSAGILLSLLGFFSWSLEGAPGGRTLIVAATAACVTALTLVEFHSEATGPFGWRLTGDLLSAALLGSATSAMLMGHMYLNAPSMTISPLMRLLAAVAITTLLRLLCSAVALGVWSSTSGRSLFTLEGDMVLWLLVRWVVGYLAPLVLVWMAWRTAKIRSTQSATGILYVVVIFCFLGELTGQLLQSAYDYPL
jgi:hypothetical protein